MRLIEKIKDDYLKGNKAKRILLISIIYRLGNYLRYLDNKSIFIKIMLGILLIIRKVFIEYIFHTELPFRAIIGEGLRLVHPYNIIINPTVIIGKNCTIFQEVTIGTNEFTSEYKKAPIIGDNVYIGAGAKVIGPINIGDNVRIGANSVVTKDIPSNCTVVGYNRIIIRDKES